MQETDASLLVKHYRCSKPWKKAIKDYWGIPLQVDVEEK